MMVRKSPANPEQLAGSPSPGEPVFLVIGRIRKPFGLNGELSMDVLTDFPERIIAGITIYIGEDYIPDRIHSCRWHGKVLLLTFEGMKDPEAAGVYRNKWVYVHAEDRPALPDGEYYHHQIIGLRVYEDNGKFLGTLTQILETGANDVYLVRSDAGQEILLPAIETVILDINVDKGELHAHILPGLIPD